MIEGVEVSARPRIAERLCPHLAVDRIGRAEHRHRAREQLVLAREPGFLAGASRIAGAMLPPSRKKNVCRPSRPKPSQRATAASARAGRRRAPQASSRTRRACRRVARTAWRPTACSIRPQNGTCGRPADGPARSRRATGGRGSRSTCTSGDQPGIGILISSVFFCGCVSGRISMSDAACRARPREALRPDPAPP